MNMVYYHRNLHMSEQPLMHLFCRGSQWQQCQKHIRCRRTQASRLDLYRYESSYIHVRLRLYSSAVDPQLVAKMCGLWDGGIGYFRYFMCQERLGSNTVSFSNSRTDVLRFMKHRNQGQTQRSPFGRRIQNSHRDAVPSYFILFSSVPGH